MSVLAANVDVRLYRSKRVSSEFLFAYLHSHLTLYPFSTHLAHGIHHKSPIRDS
jgi:hypothetical protein